MSSKSGWSLSSRVRALSFSVAAAPFFVALEARAASLPAPPLLIRFDAPLTGALAAFFLAALVFVDLPVLPESRACVAFRASAALTAEAADAVLSASGE